MSRAKPDWAEVSIYAGPEASPGFVKWREFMRWQRELNALLRPLGLTQPQFAVLAVCGWMTRETEAVAQSDVVDYLGLDRMHVSQIASKLEDNGLISRTSSAQDLRAKQIAVTQKGFEVLQQAVPIVEAFDGKFFDMG